MGHLRALTFGDRIALGWGKLRRAYFITCHPERVRRSLARRVGHCNRTGACCRLMNECPAFDGADGSPKCTVYIDRGPNCSLFPIDERDLRDRDRVMPDHSCGYRFIPESEFARARPDRAAPRFVFPWEVDGGALGGRIRRTTAFALALAFARTAWKVAGRARQRAAHATGGSGGTAPVLFLRSPGAIGSSPHGAGADASSPGRAPAVVFARVRGTSMEPRIPRGALVMVETARGGDIRPGTVACFKSGDGHLVHHIVARVRGASGPLLVHEGESGGRGLVDPADVVGRVAGVVPEEGGPLREVGDGRAWSAVTLRVLRFGGWLHRLGVPAGWAWGMARRVRVLRKTG